jgi:transcriptional regulator with XRE-family HTH domain
MPAVSGKINPKGGEPLVAKKHEHIADHPGGILRDIREEQNLSRNCVVEHVDISLRHLAAVELGEKNLSIETLRKLLQYYGTSADRIFFPETYVADGQLGEATRLLASCSQKQLQLITAFIRMLQDQKELEL